MTKVINMFAGPGAGKSTLTAGLFYEMKLKGYNVEMVTEFAKDLTWEGHHDDLGNALFVSGTQLRRMRRLVGQVDYIITDSPVLIGAMYAATAIQEPLKQILLHHHREFDNFNVIVDRVKPYQPKGRNQTEDEARALDSIAMSLPIPPTEGAFRVPGEAAGVHMIMTELGL